MSDLTMSKFSVHFTYIEVGKASLVLIVVTLELFCYKYFDKKTLC